MSATHKTNLLMLPVMLTVFFIGLYTLADARISSDELKTLTTLENNSLFSVLVNYESSSHVFFTFLLNIVHHLTDKLYIYRWVPIISGVLAVAMTYRVGKQLSGGRVALVAAFLLAVTPIFVQYLREMRGYATTVFLGMLLLYSLWQAILTGQKRYWLLLIVAAALGIYTHLYFLLIMGAVGLIAGGEWLWPRRQAIPRRHLLISFSLSMLGLGLLLALLFAPLVQQIIAVPETQTLRPPLFGPFALTGDFWRGLFNAFIFFSPLEELYRSADIFLILVSLGCLYGLWQPTRRRATLWLIAWWLMPFIGNLLLMELAPGSSAQIRFHLHVLPVYLLLGVSGAFLLIDGLMAGLTRLTGAQGRGLILQRTALYGIIGLLTLWPPLSSTLDTLRGRAEEAWSDVAAELRASVRPGDLILCEAFERREGREDDNGRCGWQLQDVVNRVQPRLPVQPLGHIAHFRGAEPLAEMLRQSEGDVWMVIYFPGPPPVTQAELTERSEMTAKQFRHSWVVHLDAGPTLMDNLIAAGHWLLTFIPEEKHQLDYHLNLAQLYALDGDRVAAQSHLEQATALQQDSAAPDWAPEMARLREAVATLRFYAPAPASPQQTTQVNFDHRLTLTGYSIRPAPTQPDALQLSFYWQPTGLIEQDYAVFVHLQDGAGHTLGQFDFKPFDDILPTSAWPVGMPLREARSLSLPADLPPGDYSFVVGLYDPTTMTRLPIINDTSGENSVRLGPVSVPGS